MSGGSLRILGIERADLYEQASRIESQLIEQQYLVPELERRLHATFGHGIHHRTMSIEWIRLPREVRRAGELLHMAQLEASWAELEEIVGQRKIRAWQDAGLPCPIPSALEQLIDLALAFYVNVRERDAAYVEHLLALGRKQPGSTFAFVVGDLHAPNLFRTLKTKVKELVFWDPGRGFAGDLAKLLQETSA